MTSVKVYNPRPIQIYKNYNLFWDRLINKLSSMFLVEEIRDLKNDESDRMYIKFKEGTEGDMFLYDCDLAIENMDNGEFYILSVADVFHYNMIHEQHNSKLKKVLFAQYERKNIRQNVKQENLHKYSPWTYFQADETNLDFFYYKRKYSKNTLKTKLYFKGEPNSRPILEYFSPNILTSFQKTTPSSYFEEVVQYKVALSVGGVGEFCYRDIEYMAMGIPFIRFEYINEMKTPLIPNVHYISIPRPDELSLDRLGTREHSQLIEKKYLEVINDNNFLEFISKNAREYYENYLQHPVQIDHTMNLLEMEKWM